MDALRDASGHEWVDVAGPVGVHEKDVIAQVLHDLAREGPVELLQPQSLQARLLTT